MSQPDNQLDVVKFALRMGKLEAQARQQASTARPIPEEKASKR